ncbi:hypothetical protein RND71_015395 [Anisodus tanguticus]|uniref:F-box domain-containing protein n=1 Tax=Anisodus tanguticus TaxID=243964 RepID=A0AAE1S718_9SOLA|nr:hypothetical protein RND71_015395 [Anisodus tanguticus]
MISADPPGDEMTNILSTLLVEALMQFRSVCKSWCSIIRDPHFVNMHMNHHSSYKESSYLISKDIMLDVAEIKARFTLYSDETFTEHKKMEFPLWESIKSFEVFGCCNVARKVINETEYDDFVVSFNMADHVFEEIMLPKSCLDDGELTVSLAVFRDSLYLFVHGRELPGWWHVLMMGEDCSG